MNDIPLEIDLLPWNEETDPAMQTKPKRSDGLIILIDLAETLCRHGKGGSLSDISLRRKIPVQALTSAAQRLKEIGLIRQEAENIDLFYLQDPPLDHYWILMIIAKLKESF